MRWLLAIISTIFIGGAELFFIFLLNHLTGVDLFECLCKESWKGKPIRTIIKALTLVLAVAILIVSFIIALHGDNPFGDPAGSEQWEPGW